MIDMGYGIWDIERAQDSTFRDAESDEYSGRSSTDLCHNNILLIKSQ